MRAKTSEAEAAYEESARWLIRAVQVDYPVGSHVYVQVSSRSTVLCEIIGHSDSWWSDPGTIIARNISTGAVHKFTASQVAFDDD